MIRVSFHTFGCKCNLSDTNDMALSLLEKGPFTILDGDIKADVHVVNTCAVTASAEAQARNLVRKLDKGNKGSLIIVSGCSNRRKQGLYDELFKSLSGHNRYKAFDNLKDDICNVVSDLISTGPAALSLSEKSSVFRTRAFVKVQDGCESFCSYCIVPFVRGKERSRPKDLIISEVNKLYGEGIKEIVITGINIGSFKGGLEPLLEDILKRTKMPRIRLSSLRPSKLTPRLIELMTENRICPHLHISLQSGSDRVLKMMNRHDYTALDFEASSKRYFEALKGRSPFMAADVIAGFPGEEADDFESTYRLVETSRLNKLHVFMFSPRPGTKAFDMKGPVGPAESRRRSQRLLDLSRSKYTASLNEMCGKKVEVLWEDELMGHSENYFPITGKGIKNTIEIRTVLGVDEKNGALIV